MCVLSSIVTTSAVQHVAQAYGAHWEPTLTRTKWICTRALELEKTRGLTCAIGFEEAIGYCIGNVVREKDGIGAAVHIALMAAEEKAAGLTLHGALERLYRRHGFAASRQVSLSLSGDDAVSRVTRLLRSIVTAPPDKIGDARVLKTVDLSLGTTLPATPGVILELEHDRRVCIRPSGTEPKLKCYLDLRMPFPETQSFSDARATADAALDKLAWALATLLA
jgi:phosphomannomutase